MLERVTGFATAAAVLFGALGVAAAPIPDMSVADWSAAHRKVSAESGSPYPGDWSNDRLPYLVEPMNCLHPDHPAQSVVVRGSAQCGKSAIGENWFCYIVDRAPGPMLIVLPSLDELHKYNRIKLQPTIDASPKIRHKVRREAARDEKGSTTSFKRFAGGWCQVTTASSSKGLQMISVRYLILEEVSEYPEDTDGRGSPIDQAEARQKAFSARKKKLIVSAPGVEGECRITAMFMDGDRRFLFVPCPHCQAFQALTFDGFQGPSDDEPRVTYQCEGCGASIDHADKNDMVAKGVWIPTRVGEDADPIPSVIPAADLDLYRCDPCEGRCRDWQPSFHIWSAYSQMETWLELWNRGEAAKRNPLKLKTFYQQDLGLPFDPATDAPDWQLLLKATKAWKRGVVPWPAAALTGFIDVQGDRLEWGLWAWGPRVQGWLVDFGMIPHEPDQPEAWDAVDELLLKSWKTRPGLDIRPDAWGIDTGGNHTQGVYSYCSSRVDMIFACKGSSDRGAPPLGTPKMQTVKDEHKREIAKVPLYLIGNFQLKSDIYQGFRHTVDGPDDAGIFKAGTLHLPDWIDEAYAKQLTAEILVNPQAEAKGRARLAALLKPGDQREWRQKMHQPNEALDIVVGARALAWHIGIDRMTDEDWIRTAAERGQAEQDEPDLFAVNQIAAPAKTGADLAATMAALAKKMGNN